MGYLTKRVPPFAAKIGITFFVTTYEITQLFWDTGLHFLHISAILFVITSLGMYIIGKIKPMEEPFIIEDKELVDIKPWKNLYRGGGFVIFVMISMYVVFSPLGLAKEGGMNSVTLISIILVGVVCAIGSLLLEKFNLERTK